MGGRLQRARVLRKWARDQGASERGKAHVTLHPATLTGCRPHYGNGGSYMMGKGYLLNIIALYEFVCGSTKYDEPIVAAYGLYAPMNEFYLRHLGVRRPSSAPGTASGSASGA
jgi:hypothetical protein